MKTTAILLLLAAGAALGACGSNSPSSKTTSSSDSTSGSAQMNDLTVVFPLATTQGDFDAYLAAKGTGSNALIPKTLYTTAVPASGHVGVGGTADMAYDDLRLVAIRFDPCFANIGPITDPSSCLNQMRLVFQSLSFQGGQTSALDGAVHAFYSLTRAQFVAAVEAVMALRGGAGDLGPLAPHPLLVSQGLTGAFATGLAKIVRTYASSSNLTRFTHFMAGNLDTDWTFIGFDVGSGKTTPMVIPTLPSSSTSVEFAAGFTLPISGSFTPETTSQADPSVLLNMTTANGASAAARQAAFDGALQIQNPNFNSPNTIDCASCHLSEYAQVVMGQGKFNLSASGDSNAFAPDPSFVSSADFAATTSSVNQPSGLNVHMISYRDTSLLIGQRVINETAAILAYVNGEQILGQAPVGSEGETGDAGSEASSPAPIPSPSGPEDSGTVGSDADTDGGASDGGAAPTDAGAPEDDATTQDAALGSDA
jgi:hypothetical protein